MKNEKINISSLAILKTGLGAVFTYAGISIITSPGRWLEFVPQWISNPDLILNIIGVLNLIIGICIIIGIALPIMSFLAFLTLLAIMIFVGVGDQTFQNFGLAMMSLAIFIQSIKKPDN